MKTSTTEIKKDSLQKWFENHPQNYFSTLAKSFNCDKNRIWRQMLFVWYIKILVSAALLLMLIWLITKLLPLPIIFYVCEALIFIVSWIYIIKLHISRFHDLWHSWRWSIVCYIPAVNVVWLIYARFFKWREWSNEYGEPVVVSSDKKVETKK